MKDIRAVFSVIVLALLGAGYLASQVFWFRGEPVRWTQTIDRPPVALLALLLLVAAVALAFVKEKESGA